MFLQIIRARKIWFTISGVLVGASLVSLALYGLKLGIDFTGGTLMEIQSDKIQSSVEIKENLQQFKEIGSIKAQESGQNTYLLRFKYIDNKIHNNLSALLEEAYPSYQELRYETIGPVIGSDLKRKAFISLSLAIIFIILYVAFAFRKIPRSLSSWKFGVTAVVALLHDVIITIGVFSLLGIFMDVEVDSLFVTALLTVMGFSVHDTIVVFDRIREHTIKDHRKAFAEAANISVNETLVRSINTSVTTLITLTALFLLAGISIRYFVLALIVGIIVGTYSSVFLASPLLVVWQTGQGGLENDKGSTKRADSPEDISLQEIKKKTKKLKKRRR